MTGLVCVDDWFGNDCHREKLKERENELKCRRKCCKELPTFRFQEESWIKDAENCDLDEMHINEQLYMTFYKIYVSAIA